jgi:hypothetical protein
MVFTEDKGSIVNSDISHNFGPLAVSEGGVGEPPCYASLSVVRLGQG